MSRGQDVYAAVSGGVIRYGSVGSDVRRFALSTTTAPRQTSLKGRVIGIYGLLAVFNIAAWIWAIIAFRGQPLLLSTGLIAWGFGLRHAVDADHIAAIDNVTRKLMQEDKRPVTVGFFFALGHSAVVLLVAALLAATSGALKAHFGGMATFGNIAGTLISAAFLFILAAINIVILRGVWRAFRQLRMGNAFSSEDLDLLLNSQGFLARIFRPLFRIVSRSWHMLPVGFLFGLGFDTATEVSLLGISAAEAAKGLSIWSVLVFPVLFAAGMTLVDTTDGILMLGAYEWAFIRPIRKVYYNLTITLVSVIVALLISGIEAFGLLGDELSLKGSFWSLLDSLNNNFNTLGFVVIGVFVASWVVSVAVYRIKGYDHLENINSTS